MNKPAENQNQNITEKIFRQAFESSMDGIAIFNMQGKLDFANSEFVKLFEYQNIEEVHGKIVRDFFPEEVADELLEAIDHGGCNGAIKLVDGSAINKNEEEIPVAIFAFLIADDLENKMGLMCSVRSTRDKKKYMRRLAESEERYRALFERSLDCVFVHDLEGKFIDANDTALRLMEYERKDLDEGKINFTDLLDETEMSKAVEMIESMLQMGVQDVLGELKLRTKHGKSLYIETKGSLLYRDGKPYAVQGIARDITDRKLAEQALKQSEERFRMLFEMSPEPIMLMGLDGMLMECNSAAEKILEINKNQLIGGSMITLIELVNAEDRSEYMKKYESVVKGDYEGPVEVGITLGSGRKLWLENKPSVLQKDGEPYGLMVISRDITERKLAEDALRESEKKYRLLAENMSDVIWTTDIGMNITYVSPSVNHFLGFSPEDMCGMNISRIMTPESVKKSWEAFEENVNNTDPETAGKGVTLELEMVKKDGSILPMEARGSFIRQEDFTAIGILGVLTDITERKENERQKEEMLLALAQTEKLASLGRLGGGIAHEINNPLGYISGNLNVLQDYYNCLIEIYKTIDELVFHKLEKLDPKAIKREKENIEKMKKDLDMDYIFQDIRPILEESHEGIKRVREIVKKLRWFTDTSDIQNQRADVNEILDNSITILSDEIKYKADLQKEYQSLPRTKCYPKELSQVFINILMNAIQAIDKKGVIKASTWSEDGMIKIKIQDTGVGMSDSQMEKIFDPFYTTHEVGTGTGLGLSISYGIIKKHGGNIKVESQPGKGSIFTLSIPVIT